MEPTELRSRLGADLLHEHLARPSVGLERIRLAPRSVQGGIDRPWRCSRSGCSATSVASSPRTSSGGRRRALTRWRAPARAAAAPPGGESPPRRTVALRRRPAAAHATCKRGVGRPFATSSPAAARTSRSNSAASTSSARAVAVCLPLGDDVGSAVATPCAAASVELDHLGRARRRVLAPHALDQPLYRDRPIGVYREHRRDRALLLGAQSQPPTIDGCLDGSQQAKPQGTSLLPRKRLALPFNAPAGLHRRIADRLRREVRLDPF